MVGGGGATLDTFPDGQQCRISGALPLLLSGHKAVSVRYPELNPPPPRQNGNASLFLQSPLAYTVLQRGFTVGAAVGAVVVVSPAVAPKTQHVLTGQCPPTTVPPFAGVHCHTLTHCPAGKHEPPEPPWPPPCALVTGNKIAALSKNTAAKVCALPLILHCTPAQERRRLQRVKQRTELVSTTY